MDNQIKECIFHLIDGSTTTLKGDTAIQFHKNFSEGSIDPNGVLNFENMALFLRHVIKIEYVR